MLSKLKNRLPSISPRVALACVLAAILAATGAALLYKRIGSNVDADPIEPLAARVDRVDGTVGIARIDTEGDQPPDWTEATVNTPVTVGDRIHTGEDSRGSIALTGHNYVRLNPDTSFDVLTLEDRRTQLALREGSALFDVGALEPDELYEVATPCGAVDFLQPGLYQIGIDGDNSVISVLSGLAQVVGQAGSGYISKGQVLTLTAAAAAQAVSSTLAPRLAGVVVDDYYRYRYPNVYDGRYASYDAYLADPFYYDPYRTSASCRYLSADIPGVYDLDDYGDWRNISGYGYCWSPRVDPGWAPFRSGYWELNNVWGPTWVSHERWGWAPYHYGRWALIDSRWFWVPIEVVKRHQYCPAPVAFIPLTRTNQVAWVPLAPGETYVPRYYDARFQPRYLATRDVIREVTDRRSFANMSAVTVVPVQSFGGVINPGVIEHVDTREVAKYRPAIDPLAINGVRELAIKGVDARRRIALGRPDRESFNRSVIASAKPTGILSRSGSAKSLDIEQVPETRKNDKLKIDRTSRIVGARRPNGLPDVSAPNTQQTERVTRSAQQKELRGRARQGDASARRELRQIKRESKRVGRTNNEAGPPSDRRQVERGRANGKRPRTDKSGRSARGRPPTLLSRRGTLKPRQMPSVRRQMNHPSRAARTNGLNQGPSPGRRLKVQQRMNSQPQTANRSPRAAAPRAIGRSTRQQHVHENGSKSRPPVQLARSAGRRASWTNPHPESRMNVV
jgi:Family of unknown function (DUF6600)/FecR protein